MGLPKSLMADGEPNASWTEPQWQRWVVATATAQGWRVRIMDQRGRPGWRGGPQDKGWPDLLLVRDRVVWLELKASGGRLRPDQEEVIARLVAAGAEVHIVAPTAWETLIEWLR